MQGHVQEILLSTDHAHNVEYVAIQQFSFGSKLHPLLQVPCLELTDMQIAVPGEVS